MRQIKLLTTALAIGSLLALGACKKDEKKNEDDTAKTDEGKTDDGAGKTTDTAANPCEGKTDEGGGGDMSMDDKKAMAEKVVAMFEAVGKAVQDNESDCNAMAAGIQKISDENKELTAKAKTMDDDPEFKKWFDETHGEKVKAVMTGAITAMMKNCAEDKGVQAAFTSLTGE
jgi:hypothetical protein